MKNSTYLFALNEHSSTNARMRYFWKSEGRQDDHEDTMRTRKDHSVKETRERYEVPYRYEFTLPSTNHIQDTSQDPQWYLRRSDEEGYGKKWDI